MQILKRVRRRAFKLEKKQKRTMVSSVESSLSEDTTTPTVERDETLRAETIAISLSGCGFLGTYHFGVISCLQHHAPATTSRIRVAAGSSMGSLAAAILILAPGRVKEAMEELITLSEEINSRLLGVLTPGFSLSTKLSQLLRKYLSEDIELPNGRLLVSMTAQKKMENVLKSEFKSRDELLASLEASCFIPGYSAGLRESGPVVDGMECIDGMLTNSIPLVDNVRTITVSPYSGSAEISPHDMGFLKGSLSLPLGRQPVHMSVKNAIRFSRSLFPMGRDELVRCYERGYMDTFRFIRTHDLLERRQGTEL